jgi:hydrogenase 3 maturation protease
VPANNLPSRTAILGIGQELRGDDALGLEVARCLQRKLSSREDVLVLLAGPAPENFTGALRRFDPQRVILVDAALMGETPGAVRWLDWREATGFSASTHSLPLSALAGYLETELGCTVQILGIQPAENALGAALSAQAKTGASVAVRLILGALLATPQTSSPGATNTK